MNDQEIREGIDYIRKNSSQMEFKYVNYKTFANELADFAESLIAQPEGWPECPRKHDLGDVPKEYCNTCQAIDACRLAAMKDKAQLLERCGVEKIADQIHIFEYVHEQDRACKWERFGIPYRKECGYCNDRPALKIIALAINKLITGEE